MHFKLPGAFLPDSLEKSRPSDFNESKGFRSDDLLLDESSAIRLIGVTVMGRNRSEPVSSDSAPPEYNINNKCIVIVLFSSSTYYQDSGPRRCMAPPRPRATAAT